MALDCHKILSTWSTNLVLEKIVYIKDIFCGKTRERSRRYGSWAGPEGQMEYRDEEKRMGPPREGESTKSFGRRKEGTRPKYNRESKID